VLSAYFVSDLHIRSPEDARARVFLRFLRKLSGRENTSHLFLMGDIFDLWIAAHEYFIQRYRALIDEICRLRDEGVEIHYFEGNHDLYLKHFWADRLGLIVHEGPAYVALANRTVRIEHGDQMDPNDRGYRFLRWFLRTPPMKFLAPRLPGNVVVRIGKSASEKSRVYTSEKKTITKSQAVTKIRTHAEKAFKQEPFDLIVSGHVHVRDHYVVEEGKTSFESVNLGTWLEAPCYYVVDGDGGRLVELTER
jgi:UDP-2,3-diacylglucosamine hydrolase